VKRIGLAVLMATLTAAGHATGTYTEVWNPPEACAAAPHRVSVAHKLAVHRHVASRAVKVHAMRMPTSAPKLVAKQNNMQTTVPADEPDVSEIPRQITPEGNVLRVDSRGNSPEVNRSRPTLPTTKPSAPSATKKSGNRSWVTSVARSPFPSSNALMASRSSFRAARIFIVGVALDDFGSEVRRL